MAKEFKLPDLGENIESADVVSVLVKAGDKIEKDQAVIEIETDKATIEVPAPANGVVKEVLVKTGDNIKVHQTIILFEESGEVKEKESKVSSVKESKEKTEKAKESNKKETAEVPASSDIPSDGNIVEFKVPDLGENIESADVVSVLVKSGDVIEKDQGLIEIETDKATIEVPSNISGKVVEILIKEGSKAKVGEVILKIETSESAAQKERPESVEKSEASKQKDEVKLEEDEKETAAYEGKKETLAPGEIEDRQPPITKGAAPAAPSVRRIARELGVEINLVSGSGPGGRISMDDVKAYVKKLNEERGTGAAFAVKQKKLSDFSVYGEIERKAMSKIRSTAADHLSYAWASIPHVTQHDKADITGLEKMRKELNPKVEKAGGKLTITSILLKVLTAALKSFPQFNSSIDMDKKEIIYKKYFNIGIAVDTEHGLIVPVIKNVDKKNLTELSVELTSLAEKARIRKISLEELQGGCITITNLGGIGGTAFTPIVNVPEVAILGVSRSSYEPVFDKEAGEFNPRLMLPLSLSYDHRIIDGADAARFLRWVCQALENPIMLI
jgi:pyruvate dehydrogenase E2 component (dihydrolipoamide acetyltransferase)